MSAPLEELRYKMAKAICEADQPSVPPGYAWRVQDELGRRSYLDMVDAALRIINQEWVEEIAVEYAVDVGGSLLTISTDRADPEELLDVIPTGRLVRRETRSSAWTWIKA